MPHALWITTCYIKTHIGQEAPPIAGWAQRKNMTKKTTINKCPSLHELEGKTTYMHIRIYRWYDCIYTFMYVIIFHVYKYTHTITHVYIYISWYSCIQYMLKEATVSHLSSHPTSLVFPFRHLAVVRAGVSITLWYRRHLALEDSHSRKHHSKHRGPKIIQDLYL